MSLLKGISIEALKAQLSCYFSISELITLFRCVYKNSTQILLHLLLTDVMTYTRVPEYLFIPLLTLTREALASGLSEQQQTGLFSWVIFHTLLF